MIFDSLTHVTPDGRWFHTAYDASETRLVGELDEAQVDKAVVVALAGFIPNEFVLEVCQRHPDRLVPGASFNPVAYETERQAVRELRAQLHKGPYQLLKLHPRLNRYDPLDSRCLAILGELASWEKPIPIWIDTLFYFQGGSLRKPIVDTIHDIVGGFPDLNFVILHAGGSWALQVVEAIRDCPNAFIDISYTLYRYAGSSIWMDLRHLLNTFDCRMVFGSDFPEVSVGEALDCFWRLTEGVPPDKCANVLGKNLCELLGG
ncbi:MAG: amidohydrolase family protein [Chloroflexota bacterium]